MGMHKVQVHFHRDATSWWVTCVHCNADKPHEPLPVNTDRWMLWNLQHPCIGGAGYYNKHDVAVITQWNSEKK